MKTLTFGHEPDERDTALAETIAEPDWQRFSYRVMAFIDMDEKLIRTVLHKATGLFGGRPPGGWTYDDQIANTRIALYTAIAELRSGTGTVFMPKGVNAYLVQWVHPALARDMETALPEGASTTNRRRTAARKVQAEMTATLGREVTAEQAADETNRRAMIVRGIRPVTRGGLIARPCDLPGFEAEAEEARAYFAGWVLHGATPSRLSARRREDLVVEYNKATVTAYGLAEALDGGMLARLTDVLPDSAASDTARRVESTRLAEALADLAAADPDSTWQDLAARHNATVIMDAGRTALTNSGAWVSATDLSESFFPPVDLDVFDGRQRSRGLAVQTSASPMIAPGESSLMVAALIAAAGERHPGMSPLITEMIDCYTVGDDVRPTRALADLCGVTRVELAEAVEQIRQTMRDLLAARAGLDEGDIVTGPVGNPPAGGARLR